MLRLLHPLHPITPPLLLLPRPLSSLEKSQISIKINGGAPSRVVLGQVQPPTAGTLFSRPGLPILRERNERQAIVEKCKREPIYPVYIRVHLRTTRIDVVIVDSLPTTANPPTTLPRQTVSPCFPRPTWIIPFHATLPMIMYFITQHTHAHMYIVTRTRTHVPQTRYHIQHVHTTSFPDRHT